MERRILVGGAHSELIAIQLAEHDGSRGFEFRDGRRVVGRDEVAEDLRTGGGADAAGAHDIFDRDGHASKGRQRLAFGGQAVDAFRLLEGALAGKREIGADRRVFFLNSLVMRLDQRHGSGFAFLNGGASGVDGE
jgi:hypothetical protein